ncbi:MAG: transposase family protein [Candidatus Rhabdochlamydia sp.]
MILIFPYLDKRQFWINQNRRYSLISILFTVTVILLCGAQNWEDIAAFAESIQDWIGRGVDISVGTPSAYTLEQVIALIEPADLEKALQEIAELLRTEVSEDTIAIDGKS